MMPPAYQRLTAFESSPPETEAPERTGTSHSQPPRSRPASVYGHTAAAGPGRFSWVGTSGRQKHAHPSGKPQMAVQLDLVLSEF